MPVYIMLSRFDLAKITRQSSDGGAADMSRGCYNNLGPFRHETLNRVGLGQNYTVQVFKKNQVNLLVKKPYLYSWRILPLTIKPHLYLPAAVAFVNPQVLMTIGWARLLSQ